MIFGAHTWGGKVLLSTYKDYKITAFFHPIHKPKLYFLQIHSSWACFLKVSVTLRTTVDGVGLCFLVACLCPGTDGWAGRHIWSSLVSPSISSYSTSSTLESSSHTFLSPLAFPAPSPLTGLVLGSKTRSGFMFIMNKVLYSKIIVQFYPLVRNLFVGGINSWKHLIFQYKP